MAKKTDNKRFHAFICFSEEDQGFVDKMTDTLESKPYLLTCVRPNRDFLPGVPVTSNIDQHLEASKRILFILSDKSMRSPWCRSQIQGILKHRVKDVEVVIVGNVTVPDYLKSVSTVKATSTMTGVWLTKLTRFLGYIACFACQREKRDTKAIVYCNNCHHGYCDPCQQQHRRQPETHQHKTMDVTDVDVGQLTFHTECPDHHKPLELFCKECHLAVCYICSVVSHKQCDVSSLTDSVSVLKQSLSTIRDKLNYNIESALKERAIIEDMEKQINRSNEEHRERVQREFRDMRTVLEMREKESLQKIQSVGQKNITGVHEKIKIAETEIQSLRETCEKISTALKSQSENTVYETYKQYENVETDYILSGITENLTLEEIQVDIDFDKFQCDLNVHEVKCCELLSEDKMTGPPILHNTLPLGDVGDVIDMCVVTRNQTDLIIMTSRCKVVHCFDLDKREMVSSLSVESRPQGVTKVSDSRVAVNLSLSQCILLVDVGPHLSLHSTLKVRNFYRGLSTLTPSTLVACSYPPSLDILDMTGRVLKSVCTDHQLTTLFCCTWSVCITRTGNLLVTDFYTNSVTCVSDTGEVLFTYKPTGDRELDHPTCVKTNKHGDVFVRDRKKLVQLTSTGLFVRDVVTKGEDGVRLIHSMCFDSQGNMCVVLANDKDETVVKTYGFKKCI